MTENNNSDDKEVVLVTPRQYKQLMKKEEKKNFVPSKGGTRIYLMVILITCITIMLSFIIYTSCYKPSKMQSNTNTNSFSFFDYGVSNSDNNGLSGLFND